MFTIKNFAENHCKLDKKKLRFFSAIRRPKQHAQPFSTYANGETIPKKPYVRPGPCGASPQTNRLTSSNFQTQPVFGIDDRQSSVPTSSFNTRNLRSSQTSEDADDDDANPLISGTR